MKILKVIFWFCAFILALFMLDLPDIYVTRQACAELPPYRVFEKAEPGKFRETTSSEETYNDNPHYVKRVRYRYNKETGRLVAEWYSLKPVGLGPFRSLMGSELYMLHPFSIRGGIGLGSCPIMTNEMFNKYIVDVYGTPLNGTHQH